MNRIWATGDVGKTHHHCVVLATEGGKLLSRRVANDEPELLRVLADVLAIGEDVTWAIGLADYVGALLIARLVNYGQHLFYTLGRVVSRASGGCPRVGKTDARSALVTADPTRMRRDLNPLRPGDEATVELKLSAARRTDLVGDQTRAFRVSGNPHRPKRYHRGLQRIFYTSAFIGIRSRTESRRFCDRKRIEGKRLTEALLASARRRVNVLWVLPCDGRCYQAIPAVIAAA
ncbi:IS110 family transposase [Streptomyces sp. NPDC087894]|uniref:IS110 family transposase n=1 Tax=Streptomyces sp. NPDC087894 TaxID=3365816 RepID=UPI003809A224